MRENEVDITHRLRQTRADMLGTPDEDHYWDTHEAAGEIERLRRWGRLTKEEREAVAWVCGDVADITGPVETTLRALLERLS